MKASHFLRVLALTSCFTFSHLSAAETPVSYGYVEPLDGGISLAPKSGGMIVEVLAKEGEVVKKGQILAQIDCEKERIEHAIAQSKLAVMEADYAMAEDTFQRHQALFEEEIVCEATLTQSRIKRDVAKAKMEVAANELALAKLKLSFFQIQAPIDGKLYKFSLKEGLSVKAGDDSHIMLGSPQVGVRMWVNPLHSPDISESTTIELQHPELSETHHSGRIIHRSQCPVETSPAAPTIQEGERFIELIVEFDEALKLPLGSQVMGIIGA